MATATAVADCSVQIAGQLQRGEVVAAMDGIVAMVDRLSEFLGCVRQAGKVCDQMVPQLSPVCLAYEQRLDTLVGHVDDALAQRDLPALAEALQHGVAPGVRDFARIESPLRLALALDRAAA